MRLVPSPERASERIQFGLLEDLRLAGEASTRAPSPGSRPHSPLGNEETGNAQNPLGRTAMLELRTRI